MLCLAGVNMSKTCVQTKFKYFILRVITKTFNYIIKLFRIIGHV